MAKDSLYNDLREQHENELLKVTKSGEKLLPSKHLRTMWKFGAFPTTTLNGF